MHAAYIDMIRVSTRSVVCIAGATGAGATGATGPPGATGATGPPGEIIFMCLIVILSLSGQQGWPSSGDSRGDVQLQGSSQRCPQQILG